MKYRLVYTKSAAKDIRKLDFVVKRKLGLKLVALQSNPLKLSTKLNNSPIGQYRARIGDYRVVFDLVGGDLVILRVRHRREVYRSN